MLPKTTNSETFPFQFLHSLVVNYTSPSHNVNNFTEICFFFLLFLFVSLGDSTSSESARALRNSSSDRCWNV